jgi:hypothetical protein
VEQELASHRWGSLATTWDWTGQEFTPVHPQPLPQVRVSMLEICNGKLADTLFIILST